MLCTGVSTEEEWSGLRQRAMKYRGLQVPTYSSIMLRRGSMCMRARLLVAVLIVVWGSASLADQFQRPKVDDSDDFLAFLLTYRCGVVERLSQIHENRKTDVDRYFILSLKASPQSYVQCIFLDNDTRMLCEASSGYYATPEVQDRAVFLRPESVAALARLGFATDDSQGNFQLMIDLNGEPDLDAIAEIVLTALYEAYGARLGDPLDWKSPLADFDPSQSSCAPIG